MPEEDPALIIPLLSNLNVPPEFCMPSAAIVIPPILPPEAVIVPLNDPVAADKVPANVPDAADKAPLNVPSPTTVSLVPL